mmetsp:Transcript_17295/g.52065  ORF Transcript_17295/g.52065 Transcript_17295/m.52065 type:complete len:233 (+) Transcript_17295:311-1009(+)
MQELSLALEVPGLPPQGALALRQLVQLLVRLAELLGLALLLHEKPVLLCEELHLPLLPHALFPLGIFHLRRKPVVQLLEPQELALGVGRLGRLRGLLAADPLLLLGLEPPPLLLKLLDLGIQLLHSSVLEALHVLQRVTQGAEFLLQPGALLFEHVGPGLHLLQCLSGRGGSRELSGVALQLCLLRPRLLRLGLRLADLHPEGCSGSLVFCRVSGLRLTQGVHLLLGSSGLR